MDSSKLMTLTSTRRWALAFAATFTMTISYIDRQTLAVLAPRVTADLHIGDRNFGWLLSAFSVAYLVGAPLAGAWIDRVGARRGLLVAVLAWTLVAALHALVPGFAVLIVLRVALGLAESPSFPGAAQTVQRALAPEDRARGLGILFTGSSVGAMIAPPLASWLMAHGSWRAAFLGTALAGLVWVPVWLACTGSRAAKAALDTPTSTTSHTSSSATMLLREPAMWRAIAMILAAAPAMGFVLLWLSKFLVGTYGVAPTAVGRWLWIPPLVYDLGSVAFGDLASRRRRWVRTLVVVAAVMLTAVAGLSRASSPTVAIAVAAFAMAGGAGVYALTTSDLFERVPSGYVSTAGGLCAAAQSIALILSSPLVGHLSQTDGNYARAVLLLSLWVLPGVLLWFMWIPRPLTMST
jgi:ACS family hexuronate transporter-like MFS transporter